MPTVIGEITPTSPSDTYPVVNSKYVTGGCQTWFTTNGDWTSTTILPLERRQAGMIVSSADAPLVKWQLGADLTTWSQLNTSAGGSRTWYIPETVLDPSGGVNPTDPTNTINTYISDASAAYDATLGPITLVFPSGTISMGEFIVKGNVIYIGGGGIGGVTHIKKRSDYVSGASFTANVNRVLLKTVRKDYLIIDNNDKCFTGYVDANPDNWYGNSDNIVFGGRFIFDPNGKLLGLHLVMLMEVRDFVVLPGAIEVWNVPSAPSGNRWWSIYLQGRNVTWFHPITRYGTETGQDGLHIQAGDRISIIGGYLQSGDDALPMDQELGGATTTGPDEGLSNVVAVNVEVDSRLARATVVEAGNNYMNADITNAMKVRNVSVINITGRCAQAHGQGMNIGDYRNPQTRGQWTYAAKTAFGNGNGYRIIDGGTGFTNGYYPTRSTSTLTGAGSGAKCAITVTGGVVTRAMPDITVSGTAGACGSGYTGIAQVDLSGIPRATATTTTAGFTMPAASATVTVSVGSNAAFTVGGGCYIATAGYFTVAAKGGTTTMDLTNTGHYQNAAPTTAIANTKACSVGTAANVQTQDLLAPDNSVVDGVYIKANLEIGSTTHDNINPEGIAFSGCKNVEIDYTVRVTENTTTPSHRPFIIRAGENIRLKFKTLNQFTQGGICTTKDWGCGTIDNIVVFDSDIHCPVSTASGIFKLFSVAGVPIGRITLRDSVIKSMNNGCAAIYCADTDLVLVNRITISNVTLVPSSGSPSNIRLLRTVGTGANQIAKLNISGCDCSFLASSPILDSANFQAFVQSYKIGNDNLGIVVRHSKLVNWGAADTTKNVTVSTTIPLPDTTTLGLACVQGFKFVAQPTNAIGNIWFTTSSATAFNINLATAPGNSVDSVVTVDVSQKPLTA